MSLGPGPNRIRTGGFNAGAMEFLLFIFAGLLCAQFLNGNKRSHERRGESTDVADERRLGGSWIVTPQYICVNLRHLRIFLPSSCHLLLLSFSDRWLFAKQGADLLEL